MERRTYYERKIALSPFHFFICRLYDAMNDMSHKTCFDITAFGYCLLGRRFDIHLTYVEMDPAHI